MSRKRTVEKHIMLSEEENEKLQKNAAKCGVSEAEYMRMLISNVEPKVLPSDEIVSFRRELRFISGNLNQLLAKANSLGFVDAPMLEVQRDKWKEFINKFEQAFFN